MVRMQFSHRTALSISMTIRIKPKIRKRALHFVSARRISNRFFTDSGWKTTFGLLLSSTIANSRLRNKATYLTIDGENENSDMREKLIDAEQTHYPALNISA